MEARTITKVAFFICLALITFSVLVIPQEYNVSVTTITVWVKALDKKGDPVYGLISKDFEIYDDDEKMEPSCFEEVRAIRKSETERQQSSESAATTSFDTSPQNDPNRRLLVLFVDLFNTNMAEYQRVRRMTKEFLDQINPKTWDVMLAAITNTGKAGIVVPFGQNITKVSEQLQLLQPNAQRDVTVMNRKRTVSQILKTDPSKIEEAYHLAHDYAKLEKYDSEKSIVAFDQLAEFLQKTVSDEHVIVVYTSGGINLEPGRVYFEIVNKFVESAALNLNSPEFAFTFPSSNKEPNFDIGRKIKRSIAQLNKKNITIYCMNTRGSANPADDNIYEDSRAFIVNDTSLLKDFQESLDQIADETGGISFRNSNNFAKGFTDILKDSQHQYTICYNAPEHKDQGKYHKIKVVSLKPGIKLRFRKGYIE